jgi:hypothetical protein
MFIDIPLHIRAVKKRTWHDSHQAIAKLEANLLQQQARVNQASDPCALQMQQSEVPHICTPIKIYEMHSLEF